MGRWKRSIEKNYWKNKRREWRQNKRPMINEQKKKNERGKKNVAEKHKQRHVSSGRRRTASCRSWVRPGSTAASIWLWWCTASNLWLSTTISTSIWIWLWCSSAHSIWCIRRTTADCYHPRTTTTPPTRHGSRYGHAGWLCSW